MFSGKTIKIISLLKHIIIGHKETDILTSALCFSQL